MALVLRTSKLIAKMIDYLCQVSIKPVASMLNKDKEDIYNLDPSARAQAGFVDGDSSTTQSQKLYDALRDDVFMVRVRQLAWKEFCRNSGDSINMQKQVNSILDDSGLKEAIKSAVVKTYNNSKVLQGSSSSIVPANTSARFVEDEKIDCIRKARQSWEQGINEELLAIAAESKRPFLSIRPPADVNPLMEPNVLQSSPAEAVKFLFDSEDLLETGLAIQNPNMNPVTMDRYMGLLKLNLPVMDLEKVIEAYSEMSCLEAQFGVDEGNPTLGAKFCASRHDEGESVLQQGSILDARHYARRGVPPGLRARIWRRCCGFHEEALPSEEQVFLRQRCETDRLDLLTDELFLHDIQTVIDDPRYFIFEDELKEVIFGFSRDEWVRENCHYQIHTPLLGKLQPMFAETCAMPPCAVQPFLGFATYFAPLCYVLKSRPSLYTVSRSLYCQLWCRLNVLSSDANTLLPVCKLFEVLLLQTQPALFMHMVNIGLQPLKVAFSWIQLGFVGLLEVDQLLHLWDRVIGYMDLNIFAVAAASIFMVRAEPLFKCTTEAEANMVLVEASRLRIVTIMQMFLFKDTRMT